MKTMGMGRRLICTSVLLAMGLLTAPAWVQAKATYYKATIDVRPAHSNEVDTIKGFVFEDLNRDGRFQRTREPGIPGVMVSDSLHNVWNGSRDSEVYVQIGDRAPLVAERTQAGAGEGFVEIPDPFALRLQLYSYRYAAVSTSGNGRAQGFELFRGSKFGTADPQPLQEFFLTTRSNHLWRVKLPGDLPEGVHVAKVLTVDANGTPYTETIAFEVLRTRPDQETEAFFQQAFFGVLP